MSISPMRKNPHTLPAKKFSARNGLAAAVLAAAMIALGACTPGDGDDQGGSPDPGTDGNAATATTPAEPAIADDDGYWRANTLPEPLESLEVSAQTENGVGTARLDVISLDREGENARLVVAWLPPVDGVALNTAQLGTASEGVSGRPWARLVDRANSTVHGPLTTDVSAEKSGASALKAGCVCSAVLQFELAEPAEKPKATDLVYLDFPAPESSEVSVLAGEWMPSIDGVPMTDGEPFAPQGDLATFSGRGKDLPATYGEGGENRNVLPITDRIDSLTGSSETVQDGVTSVSIPSDVLFAFDESTLDKDAEKVIDDAAAKLVESAAGKTVVVEGHTDDEGEESYNQELGQKRADAVRDAIEPKLAEAGIALETKSLGETKPLAPNTDSNGDPIEKNREQNRRVSFVFDAAPEADLSIDTGIALDELPEMKPADAPAGAVASGILVPPEGDRSPELRVDVLSAERTDAVLRLELAYSAADGAEFTDDAFDAAASVKEARQFGINEYSFAGLPGAGNIGLVDEDAGKLYRPRTGDGQTCLCSETTSSRADLYAEGTPMWVEFPAPDDGVEALTLRLAPGGQMEIPLTADASGGGSDPAASTPAGSDG